ncbi:MAG: ribonuclease H-like domain-containing protein [Armatimonadetes bacterium]|nr:ribonuclease H-like domain-containing protein [Armatimonadota bacterium]
MLTNTFCHIPKIGRKTEEQLWEEGILSWEDCLEYQGPEFKGRPANRIAKDVYASVEALENREVRWFAERLPVSEAWRMFPEFRERTAYLDIETTGMGWEGEAIITSIALWDGHDIRSYIYGQNLRDFRDEIDEYDLLVTYNGKSFDVPFIERYFGRTIPHAHIDLRYVLHSLGIKGGLKGSERQFGLERGDLDGVDGYFAVLLWHHYQALGDERALQTLLAYNVQDTITLEHLMVAAYNLKLEETPFTFSRALREPKPPANPFTADREIIEQLRQQHGLWGGTERLPQSVEW